MTATNPCEGLDLESHPCFSEKAKHKFGRVHLPVAPKCNIKCNFCSRRFDCANESRPGVSSKVLTPGQAVYYLDRVLEQDARISVVGIAGPGDPFANPDETMETLRLVRKQHPEMLLCVATNGLGVGPYIDELAELKTSHVTLTINAVDPEIGEQVYAWVRPHKKPSRGLEGAKLILERQLDALKRLKEHNLIVKVNTVVIPGINDEHVRDIARTVSELGADMYNAMPLHPVEGTPFEDLTEPSKEDMRAVQSVASEYMPLMKHCERCRADAAGMLGADDRAAVDNFLSEAQAQPSNPEEHRPYVAVASMEGLLVNQHLGHAEQLWVFGAAEGGGFELIETRPTPAPGASDERWTQLAKRLTDCRAVIAANAGQKPMDALKAAGVTVHVAEGLVEESLEALYADRPLRMPVHAKPGKGTCGGCPGTGTGCG